MCGFPRLRRRRSLSLMIAGLLCAPLWAQTVRVDRVQMSFGGMEYEFLPGADTVLEIPPPPNFQRRRADVSFTTTYAGPAGVPFLVGCGVVFNAGRPIDRQTLMIHSPAGNTGSGVIVISEGMHGGIQLVERIEHTYGFFCELFRSTSPFGLIVTSELLDVQQRYVGEDSVALVNAGPDPNELLAPGSQLNFEATVEYMMGSRGPTGGRIRLAVQDASGNVISERIRGVSTTTSVQSRDMTVFSVRIPPLGPIRLVAELLFQRGSSFGGLPGEELELLAVASPVTYGVEGSESLTLINPDPDPKEALLIGGKQTFSADVGIDLPEPLPGGQLQLVLFDTATDDVLARGPLTPLVGQTGMQMLTLPDVTLLEEGEFALQANLFDEDLTFLGMTNSIIYRIGLDFEVLWIEVTQVIQDNGNNVPLVANKKTFARVYAKRNLPPGEPSSEQPVVPRLEVQLTGARGGQELGQAKPLGPSTAEALPILAINIPVREASPITSAIFELPLAWTNAGNLVLTATVNPEGAVPEVNSENNSYSWEKPFTFKPRNSFNIVYLLDLDKPRVGLDAHKLMAKIFPTTRVNYEPLSFLAAKVNREKYLVFLEITTDLYIRWLFKDSRLHEPSIRRRGPLPFGFEITLVSNFQDEPLLAQAAARLLGLQTRLCRTIGARIGDVGFDPETKIIKIIKLSLRNQDFIEACFDLWVSPETYTKLFDTELKPKLPAQKPDGNSMSSLLTLGSPPRKRQSERADYLILSGAAGQNGNTPRLDPAYRLQSSIAPLALPDVGEWCLELAGDGGLLSRHCIEEALDGGEFVAKLPYLGGTQRISLTDNGQEVVARAASANAPSLQITSPAAGANLDASAPLTIAWMASDADGDGLLFAVLYSADGGESWFPLTFDFTDAQFTFDGAQIQGGGDVFFRVLASDGFHTSEQVVGPVTVTQRPVLQVDDRVRLGSAAAGQPAEGFVTLTGAGTGPVVIEAVTSDSPGFGVDPNTLPLTVLVGMSRKLFVEFTPSGVGVETAMLTLTTNSPDQPNVNVLVEAEGLDPAGPILDTDLTEESIAFGGVGLGQASPAAIFLMNRGAVELNVEFAVEGEGFRIVNGTAALRPEQARQNALTLGEYEHASLTVFFEPASLGEFTGRLVLTSNDPAHARMEIALSGVGIELPLTPMINAGGVVEAAQFGPTLAPGGIGSLFGVELAGEVAQATAVPLPTELAGVQVHFNGIPAPLFFVSPNQMNFQVPFETPLGGQVEVSVIRDGEASGPEVVEVTQYAPGIFANPATGEPIVTRHPDGSLINAANPARPGDVLIIFATGVGDVSNPPPTGATALGSPLSVASVLPSVTVGAAQAQVFFAGLTPGFVGLAQINIQLPDSLPAGNTLEMVVDFAGSASQPVNLPVASQ